jgi:ethanolamine utilization microcompartment shell protein EutS
MKTHENRRLIAKIEPGGNFRKAHAIANQENDIGWFFGIGPGMAGTVGRRASQGYRT